MPPVQPKPSKKELAAEKKKAEGKGRGRGRGAKQNAAPQQMSDLMPQHFTAAGGKGSPKTKMARIPKITERVSLPTPDSLGLAGMQVGRELFFEFLNYDFALSRVPWVQWLVWQDLARIL